MAKNISVQHSKNLFLLYSLLNVTTGVDDSVDSHFLRRKTFDHFKDYEGLGLCEEDFVDYSWLVTYVLTLDENLEEGKNLHLTSAAQQKVVASRKIRPHLVHFKEHTDFDQFYVDEILPVYEEICSFLQGICDRLDLASFLDEIWGVEGSKDFSLIPMPLRYWDGD